jgi:predicted N-acyltransferase
LRTLRGTELGTTEARLAWRFYEATSSKNSWGTIQLTQEFFERAFATLPGSVELVVAERAGTVVAGAFNLSTPKRLYGRYWGCFEDHPFLHFHVCLYHSIDDCIRLGKEAFEPGAGGEHKISRGFEPSAIHSAHQIFDARFKAVVMAHVAREREELARVISHGEEVAGMRPWTGPTRSP